MMEDRKKQTEKPVIKNKKTGTPAIPLEIIDFPEEHRIILPGLDIAINHTLKIVFVVDQTGGQDHNALQDLEDDLISKGYYLHCVVVAPPTQPSGPE